MKNRSCVFKGIAILVTVFFCLDGFANDMAFANLLQKRSPSDNNDHSSGQSDSGGSSSGAATVIGIGAAVVVICAGFLYFVTHRQNASSLAVTDAGKSGGFTLPDSSRKSIEPMLDVMMKDEQNAKEPIVLVGLQMSW